MSVPRMKRVTRRKHPARESQPSKSIRLTDYAYQLARERMAKEHRTSLANTVDAAVIYYCLYVPVRHPLNRPSPSQTWEVNEDDSQSRDTGEVGG